MRITRFYLPNANLVEGNTLSLSKEHAHYAMTVLRLKHQRIIEVFDGNGHQANATLLHTSRRSADIFINTVSAPMVESPLHTILAQAISKGDRMDTTIQKTVELGINQIQPLITEHCDLKRGQHAPDAFDKKCQQWQDIANNACEQSGRNTVPRVKNAQNYLAWLAELNENTEKSAFKGFVLDPYASETLSSFAKQTPAPSQPVYLLVGPEGGLSENEVAQAVEHGFQPIRLGPRILRTETAGMTVLAILQSLWGDF